MANILVGSSEALVAAVKDAKNGDVISVASGTYSSILLKNIQISGNVTIQSADANHQAVFTDMNVRESKGLTFRNLEFAVDPAKGIYPFRVTDSANIVLDKLNVHGTMNSDVSDDTSPLLIRQSTNVSVTNSEFQQVWHGVSVMDSNKVAVTGNSFHDIRTDGVRVGGTSNLNISGNYFTDFYNDGKDHPDAIQIWSTNATASAANISIADNVIVRGKGDPYQGIFIRDTFDNLPFKNVSITGNTVIGALYNGIAIDGVDGVKIDKNVVAGQDGQSSWIRVQNATAATVSNNMATAYNYIDTPVVAKASNILLASTTAKVASTISAWLESHSDVLSGLGKLLSPTLTTALSKIGYVDAGISTLNAAKMEFDEVLVNGTSGNDRLTVSAVGDTRIIAGDGNDTLTGGVSGENTLIGGRGDDIYHVKGAGDVVIEDSDGGTDTVSAYISYTLTENVETLRMMTGGLTGHGNELDNRIVGSTGIDMLYGEDGDDLIQGAAGNDQIWGGNGDDQLRGDDGDDMIYGGAGADQILGGTGHDKIWGGADGDTIKGEDGNDTIYGEAGNDFLYGGAGNDVIDGGTGNNWIEGGAGADRLIGGRGADTFAYRSGDFADGVTKSMDDIIGFSSAEKDRINLAGIDANTKTTVDDKFGFIGKADFHKVAGELRYEVSGKDAYVYGDVNGDGKADFAIHLVGVTTLAASDFVL